MEQSLNHSQTQGGGPGLCSQKENSQHESQIRPSRLESQTKLSHCSQTEKPPLDICQVRIKHEPNDIVTDTRNNVDDTLNNIVGQLSWVASPTPTPSLPTTDTSHVGDDQTDSTTSGLNTRTNHSNTHSNSLLEKNAPKPKLQGDNRKARRVSVSVGHTVGNIHHWVVTIEPNSTPSQDVGYLGLTEGLCNTEEGDDGMHYIGPDMRKLASQLGQIDSTDGSAEVVPPSVCCTESTSPEVGDVREGNDGGSIMRGGNDGGSTMREGNNGGSTMRGGNDGGSIMREGNDGGSNMRGGNNGGSIMREGNDAGSTMRGGSIMREGNIVGEVNCVRGEDNVHEGGNICGGDIISGRDTMHEGGSASVGESRQDENKIENDLRDRRNENIIHVGEGTNTPERNGISEVNSIVEEGNTPSGGNMTSDRPMADPAAEGVTDQEPRDVEQSVPEHFLSSLQLMTKDQDKIRKKRKPRAEFTSKLRPTKKKQLFTSIKPRTTCTKPVVAPDVEVGPIKLRLTRSAVTPDARVGSGKLRPTKTIVTPDPQLDSIKARSAKATMITPDTNVDSIKPRYTKIKNRQLDQGHAGKTLLVDLVSPGIIGPPGRDEIDWNWPQDSDGPDPDQDGTDSNLNEPVKKRKRTYRIHNFTRTPDRGGSKSTLKKTDFHPQPFNEKYKSTDETCKPCCVDLGKRVSDGVERQTRVDGKMIRGPSSPRAGSEVGKGQPGSKVGQGQRCPKVFRKKTSLKAGRGQARKGRGLRFVVGGAPPTGEHTKSRRDSREEMSLSSFPCKYCKKSFWLKSQLMNHTCRDRKDQVLAEALKLMTERQKTSNVTLVKKSTTRRPKGRVLEDTVNRMSERRNESQVKTERDLESPNSLADQMQTKRLSLQKYDKYKLKQFGCAHCSVVFLRKDNLLKHLLIHSGNRPFACQVCEMKFLRKDQLLQHERIHTGEKPFQCEICSKSFLAKGNLKRHELTHTVDKPFKCDRCDEAFIRKFQLDVHKRIHSGKKPFKCRICRKGFRCAVTLNIHQRSHTGETPYACGQCDKAFKQKQSLSKHEFLVHGVKREHTFECGHCEREFMCRSDLTKHASIHTEERPFECLIQNCGKRFRKKFHLIRHELTHSGEKLYKCETCQKRFATDGSLKKHERVHTGEKPFKCSHCTKEFAQKVGLQQHERIHTGDKPYKCSYCDMAFAQRSNLLSHERVHTGKKPYKCGYCQKAFAARSNMKRHEVTHENGAGARNIKEESETDLSEWSE